MNEFDLEDFKKKKEAYSLYRWNSWLGGIAIAIVVMSIMQMFGISMSGVFGVLVLVSAIMANIKNAKAKLSILPSVIIYIAFAVNITAVILVNNKISGLIPLLLVLLTLVLFIVAGILALMTTSKLRKSNPNIMIDYAQARRAKKEYEKK
ncbi:MAG: hypothetical protein FWE43_00610 [Streptococcaceae bacterium]|nr:hypothetical protein [Streptococcaceae bacterium]